MPPSAASSPQSDAWGIQRAYVDATGETRVCGEDTIEQLRSVMGDPDDDPDRVRVVPSGQAVAVGPGRVELEGGGEVSIERELPPDLPLGYHRFVDDEGTERTLVVAPPTCYLPPSRCWGLAAQLYAVRSSESWGIGDYADLRRLGAWTESRGGGMLLVNPLHASAPVREQQPSPYFPTSRRFASPLYLRIEEVPGARDVGLELEPLCRAGRALVDDRRIDRDEVWRLKQLALEKLWSVTGANSDGFGEFVDRGGDSLHEFATWCALAEEHGRNWRTWPADVRHPRAEGVVRFARRAAARVRFWMWVQWLCAEQLGRAAQALPIMQDLPIGFDPDGADAWAFQDLLAQGVSVGAPPDAFNATGQDWGLPPFIPARLRAAGLRPFIDTVRSTMARDGGLRIDHVMGLQRLWWIPVGRPPAEGAYVRYRAPELLAVIAIESQRHRAVVVGEDLGTVEEEFRARLQRANILSYRLLWFEKEPPETWPELALAAVTTHDLPTVVGLWSGSDLAEQERLGLEVNRESTEEIRDRLMRLGELDAHADDEHAVEAAHRLLGRAPARIALATLEDLVAEPSRPNIPGADDQRANWSCALPVPLETLERSRLARDITELLEQAVRDSSATAQEAEPSA